ncbi:MAG: ABC transporter ATP-binding protein [Pseudomonadota bacterium]
MQPEDASSACISIRNLKFAWAKTAPVLSIDSLTIERGERLFLYGPSGSGKSTLLSILAGVLEPSGGEATVLGRPFHKLAAAARDRVRADAIGVMFQQFNLIPYLNLVENVLLPCRFSPSRAERVGPTEAARARKARELLDRLGLDQEARTRRSVAELSVGEQQRVAAARALIGAPSLLIADEPTSALDTDTRDVFIELLLAESSGSTVLFVSHDASLDRHFDRRITMDAVNFRDERQTPPVAQHADAALEV